MEDYAGWTLTQGAHMFARADWLEADEGHLHTGKGTNGVPRAVCSIEAMGEAAHEHENKGVEGNHVGNEDVST